MTPLSPTDRQGRTSDGLAYAVRGTGPALLLLSGFGVSSRGLDSVVDVLSARFTCLTFDYRGSGGSAVALGPVTTGSMARDAARVLQAAGVERAHVVGVSLGGMVAQELAIQRPGLVHGLVLVATTAGGWGVEPPSLWALRSSLSQVAGGVPGGVDVRGRTAMLHAWAAATHDASGRLDRITALTLVCHGERDTLVSVDDARVLADRIPHAELRLVPDRGHLLLFDAADSDLLLGAAWLAALPAPEGRGALASSSSEVLERAVASAVSPLLPTWRTLRMMLRVVAARRG